MKILQDSGFASINHSGGTLFDHLVGTYELLTLWKAPLFVCAAGLFHTIYGTQSNNVKEPPNSTLRSAMIGIISYEAEHLTWLFSIMKKADYYQNLLNNERLPINIVSRFDHSTIALNTEMQLGMPLLLAANWVEVMPRSIELRSINNVAPLLHMANHLDAIAALGIVRAIDKWSKE